MSSEKKTLQKQISEYFPVEVRFNNVLQSGETLGAGSTVLAYDYTGSLVSDGVIQNESSIAFSDATLQTDVISGSLDQTYKLSFRAKTSLSNIYEQDVFVIITD